MTETATQRRPPRSEEELEDLLTEPTPETVEAVSRLEGDVLILGAGGKMGPSLAVLAKRSIEAAGGRHRVICASRFSSTGTAKKLDDAGIETIACELLDRDELQRLPEAPNVLYLAGMKFGATGSPELTWALNCYLPAIVAERFRRSRIVALSTGNVYPLVEPRSGGATEETPPSPIGEYAQSCLGRERLLQHMSLSNKTPVLIVRLNYATDLRYGVLLDIAERVRRGEPVDLSMPWLNVIWQGDANAILLRAFGLASVPAHILNLTGADIGSVREIAERFAARFKLPPPVFASSDPEPDVALLSDASHCHALFGPPRVSTQTLIEWVATWVEDELPTLGKPTHFETRDGNF